MSEATTPEPQHWRCHSCHGVSLQLPGNVAHDCPAVGFTWEHVEKLREFANTFMSKQEAPSIGGGPIPRLLDEVADRIATLLPPR